MRVRIFYRWRAHREFRRFVAWLKVGLMNAVFRQEGTHRAVIELRPDHGVEAILMAAFIRYDENSFRVSVERYDDGQIKSVILETDQAN